MFINFFHAFEGVLIIVIMFMIGWVMTQVGWLDDKTSATFSRIIMNVSLPCYMLWNITNNFDRDGLIQISGGLLVPFVSKIIAFLLSIAFSNLLHIRNEIKGVFRSVFFTSNTIFVGLPVNLALFGAESIPYVLLYYVANTTIFWTLGNYEISRDGKAGKAVSVFSKENLRRILNPALLGFVLSVLLVLLGIRLPVFITKSCQYIGQMTTPLAMLFIGIVLHSIKIKNMRIDRETIFLLVARFVINPLIVIALEQFIPLPPLMAKVFIVQSAMPAMTSTGIVAKDYGADYEYATWATVVTTVCSMVAIPVIMAFI